MSGECFCGSGQQRRELKDARGIFCTFVCDKCEARRRTEFRPDIFSDSQYEADEPIEDE
jgi:hypothetical protein